MSAKEIEQIVEYILYKEEMLVDEIKLIMEDMRSNAFSLDRVKSTVERIEKAISQASY